MPTEAARGHGLHAVRLDGPTDFDGFRRACRSLVAQGIRPEQVTWETWGNPEHRAVVETDLFGSDLFGIALSKGAEPAVAPRETAPDASTPLRVPAVFASLCDSAILHRDPARFGLLYRLLWRFQNESGLRHDPLDIDRMTLSRLAHAVHRDLHKMKAFVRFTRIEPDADGRSHDGADHQDSPAAPPLHVA